MKLFTKAQLDKLLKNGEAAANDPSFDAPPVVKLFTPDGAATWLISEIDPQEPDIAFGLCDLGMGFPELGNVSITELKSVRGALGLPIERDLHFEGKAPLSAYADLARVHERIIESLPAPQQDADMELE